MSKLRINFILKSVSGENKPILLVANFGYKEVDQLTGKTNYKNLKFYTGITTLKSEWNKNINLIADNKKIKRLLELEKLVTDIFNYLKIESKTITPELLRNEIDLKLNRKTAATKTLRIRDYIENVMMRTNVAKNTLKQYSALKNRIEDFENEKGTLLFAHQIDENTFNAFINYVRSTVNRINSVWSYYKGLRAVLKDIERKYDIPVFKPSLKLSAKDKVQPVSEEKVYLNLFQLQTILEYQPKTESLRNVQFILCVLAFTGCRYSDVFKIIPEHEYEKKGVKFRYAHFLTEKTDTEIKVPILKPLSDFFEKNDWNPPYKISEQKFNNYVKDLVELAKLNDKVTLSFTNSYGQKEFETKPLFQFVTSHIGRRSFITNLINFVPISILAKITGHTIKDKSIIFGYNKITLLENAALFVKELKRVQDTYKEDFPIDLV